MIVKELIKQLKKFKGDEEVLIYSDAEGNNLHGLNFLDGAGPAVYIHPDEQYLEDI